MIELILMVMIFVTVFLGFERALRQLSERQRGEDEEYWMNIVEYGGCEKCSDR